MYTSTFSKGDDFRGGSIVEFVSDEKVGREVNGNISGKFMRRAKMGD